MSKKKKSVKKTVSGATTENAVAGGAAVGAVGSSVIARGYKNKSVRSAAEAANLKELASKKKLGAVAHTIVGRPHLVIRDLIEGSDFSRRSKKLNKASSRQGKIGRFAKGSAKLGVGVTAAALAAKAYRTIKEKKKESGK